MFKNSFAYKFMALKYFGYFKVLCVDGKTYYRLKLGEVPEFLVVILYGIVIVIGIVQNLKGLI